MNALVPTLQQRDYSPTERMAREWAATFAELYGVKLEDRGPRFVNLWVSTLVDLAPSVLNAACKRATQTCKFFPTPAEVRVHVDSAEQLNLEDEWQALLNYCREWVHPDMQFSGAPELPPDIDHAARAAGGVHLLRECAREELQWRKKEFIADLTRMRNTGDIAGLLQPSAFRKLLRQSAPPVAQLPEPRKATAARVQASGSRVHKSTASVATVREVFFGAPLREKSETELAEELRSQKQVLRDRGWLPKAEDAAEVHASAG